MKRNNTMLRKMITALLLLALVGLVPVLVGCEQNESHRHMESKTTETQTRTVPG